MITTPVSVHPAAIGRQLDEMIRTRDLFTEDAPVPFEGDDHVVVTRRLSAGYEETHRHSNSVETTIVLAGEIEILGGLVYGPGEHVTFRENEGHSLLARVDTVLVQVHHERGSHGSRSQEGV